MVGPVQFRVGLHGLRTGPAGACADSPGPKTDGTYLVEFRAADGQSLAISVPGSEPAVLRHFQARIPYGLVDTGLDES